MRNPGVTALLVLFVMRPSLGADDRGAQEKAALPVLRALPRTGGAAEFGLTALRVQGTVSLSSVAFSPTENILAAASMERISMLQRQQRPHH
jgi:hypothetical protein